MVSETLLYNSDLHYEFNGKNLNTIDFNCQGSGNTTQVTNCKNTGYGAVFEVIRYSADYIVQIQRDATSGGSVTYKRCKSAGTWTAWVKEFEFTDLMGNVSSRMATGSVLVGGNFNQIRLQVETYSGSKVLAVYNSTTNTLVGNIPIP